MKNFAIGAGHTLVGYGTGANGYVNEGEYVRQITPLVVRYINELGHNAKEFRVDKSNSYENEDCYIRSEQVNAWGANVYCEIHLNSYSKASANGTEVLVLNENCNGAKAYAKRVNYNLYEALGTVDRTNGKGYKTQELIVLRKTNMDAILVECFFCSNIEDCNKSDIDKIARAIAEGLVGAKLPKKDQWIKDDIGWWYKHADGSYTKNERELINTKWYYFDERGYMKKGKITDPKGNMFYCDEDGSMVEKRWIKIDNLWYYFGQAGYMYKDMWYEEYNKKYHFDKDGVMATGIKEIEGKTYRFNNSGYLECEVEISTDHQKCEVEKNDLKNKNKELEDKLNKVKEAIK